MTDDASCDLRTRSARIIRSITATASCACEPTLSKLPDRFLVELQVDRGNLNEKAYAVLRNALMSGRFQPGQKLLLRPLARELGISITPVREALLKLVSEQALTTDSSRSITVPVVSLQRFLEIRDLRIELEGRAVEAAVRRATVPDLTCLAALQSRLIEHRRHGRFLEALGINETFHFTVYRLARMPVLYRIIEGLWIQIGPVLTRLYNQVDAGSVELEHPHDVLIRAMRGRDVPAARLALAGDILWASRHLEGTLASE